MTKKEEKEKIVAKEKFELEEKITAEEEIGCEEVKQAVGEGEEAKPEEFQEEFEGGGTKPEEENIEETVAEEGIIKATGREDEEEVVPEKCEGEEMFVLKVGSKPQGPTFADKLVNTINEAGEVAAAAVVVGYKKAEAFVKSEEFKQGVETTKKTTAAVAGGLYRGFGKLVKEVKQSVEDVKK